MKRRTLLLLAALLGATLASAGRLEAQTRFYIGASGDTAIGLIPGRAMPIPLRGSYYCAGALSAGRWTIRYDTSKVRIAGLIPGAVDSLLDTTASTPGLFSVRGTNVNTMPCGYDQVFFTLQAVLNPSASGTFLWTSVDTFTTPSGNVAQAQRSSIAQVCRATNVFGDVDGNGSVDSRDALIVLSAAVGLPVTGFDLAAGDVDRDGLTTSRDALFILTYSIGLSVPTTLSIGEGAPASCPGTTAPGEAVAFKRNGSGIELLGASSTTPTLVPHTVPGDSAPRLASNGTLIVYQCQDSVYAAYSGICSVNTDGTAQRPLSNFYVWSLPDLSPNGIRVLMDYQSYYGPLYTTTDTASALVTLEFLSGGYALSAYAAAWSRDGSRFAYTSGGFYTTWNNQVYTYQPKGLWQVDTSAVTFTKLDTAYTNTYAAPRYSPAGDSVAYIRNDGRIWAVPVTGGVPAVPYTNFLGTNSSNTITAFDWGPQGLIFSFDATGDGSHPSLWLLPSQTSPIQRITAPAAASGDWQPSFRRNP
ncbi:MAG: dockerin type I domain-containing protein [Gemmatimonadales bacterium]|jgi:hypothetical protein